MNKKILSLLIICIVQVNCSKIEEAEVINKPEFINKWDIQFNYIKQNQCGHFSFKDKTIKNPTYWLWEFGDREKSTDQNPDHTYTTNGKFIVLIICQYR